MIAFDGTFYHITDPKFEMTIPAWQGYEADTADEADATITFRDGLRRYATFMTLDVVEHNMDKNARTGEFHAYETPGSRVWRPRFVI
ncbi:hypothetical protein [Nonomuraea rhodomycinica]|uniref:Uncharacterized protein n=1 Tax=Nonomuraea rhodomycinica TaxID=1712872 RepID=A0A7Y6IW83_9ACTN|nr:hypothetical protein [Nonomuraea rhodomycinica]NUW44978.1 hypothetical protein [Nonomuraea rhodomycinica]